MVYFFTTTQYFLITQNFNLIKNYKAFQFNMRVRKTLGGRVLDPTVSPPYHGNVPEWNFSILSVLVPGHGFSVRGGGEYLLV